MILITDGVPTADGTNTTYYTDSDEVIKSKLNKIKTNTEKKIKELKKDNVKISAIFTTNDSEEKSFIQGMANATDSVNSFIITEDTDGEESSIEKVTKIIEEESKSNKKTSNDYNIANGVEDKNRQKEINNNFVTCSWLNTNLFQIINNYATTDNNKAVELSNKVYGKVIGSKTYTIKNISVDESIHEHTVSVYNKETKEWEEEVDYYYQTKVNHTGHSGQDLYLMRRPTFTLGLKVDVTRLTVILPNNSVLFDESRNFGSDMTFIRSLSDQDAYGSTIRLEFTTQIKNNSSLKCEDLEIINYLPKGFVYKGIAGVATETQKWNVSEADLNALEAAGSITTETKNKHEGQQAIKIALKGDKGFSIAAGDTYEVRIVCERIIGSYDDLSKDPVSTQAEVLSYKNSAFKRMTDNEAKATLVGVYPGNNDECDYSESKEATIIPPTGGKTELNKRAIVVEIAVISVLTIIIINAVIKKSKKVD